MAPCAIEARPIRPTLHSMTCAIRQETLGDVQEACRDIGNNGRLEFPRGLKFEFTGVDRVRLVAMPQPPLETVLNLLLRRAIASSSYGDCIRVHAENRDTIPSPLLDEERPCRCVMLSVEDEGLPVDASAIARAMWLGLGEGDPGVDTLAWVYHLVRKTGGRVDVQRPVEGGTRVRCFLPTAPES